MLLCTCRKSVKCVGYNHESNAIELRFLSGTTPGANQKAGRSSAGRCRYAAAHLRSQGLPASAAPAGGGKACPAWQRRGRILYGTGRKINPETYDKNTTQTGDDLCRICHGKRRKPLKMLDFCFLENRGNRFTRRRSRVPVQQSPPKKGTLENVPIKEQTEQLR